MLVALLPPHHHLAARRAVAQGSLARTNRREKVGGRAAKAPLRGPGQRGATASPPKATSQALRANLQAGVVLAGRPPALASHPVLEEGLAVTVHREVGMLNMGMTATPGAERPRRAPVPTEMRLGAAGRGQTAPMAADTGPPVMRGTAALTHGDVPSAPMVPAGPPAPAPCLGEYLLLGAQKYSCDIF